MSKALKGKKRTIETKQKLSIQKSGSKNPMWKGDKVGYIALHTWVKRNKSKPELCEICNKNKSYDLANISGKYLRDINDFKWTCRRCHMIEDGRINNLKQFQNDNNNEAKHL